jgi:hypothetical protein
MIRLDIVPRMLYLLGRLLGEMIPPKKKKPKK